MKKERAMQVSHPQAIRENRGNSRIIFIGLVMLLGGVQKLPAADPAPVAPKTSVTKTPVTKRDMSKAEALSVTTSDGLPLHFVYWGSEEGQEAPVVILLHGKGGHYKDWPVAFVEQLHKGGYASVLVDLRGHGQSKGTELPAEQRKTPLGQRLESGKLKGSDYQDMVNLDLEAIKQFIYEEHQRKYLNMNRTAIIASDMSTPIAASYTLVDLKKDPYEDSPNVATQTPRGQDIRGLILISPLASISGVSTGLALKEIRLPEAGVAVMLAYGTGDRLDEGASEKLFKTLNPSDKFKNRMYLQKFETPLRGTEMMGKNLGLEQQILTFLDRHVKGNGMEWRSRESRLKRKP